MIFQKLKLIALTFVVSGLFSPGPAYLPGSNGSTIEHPGQRNRQGTWRR